VQNSCKFAKIPQKLYSPRIFGGGIIYISKEIKHYFSHPRIFGVGILIIYISKEIKHYFYHPRIFGGENFNNLHLKRNKTLLFPPPNFRG